MPTNNAIDTGIPIEVTKGGTLSNTFTAYSVLTAGTTATGAFQNVSGIGTAGQILASAGAAALPFWATPYAKKIQTQTANNSASIAFTTGIAAPYNTFILVVSNYIPIVNFGGLQMQISTNGGASYINSNYTGGIHYGTWNGHYVASLSTTTCFYLSLNQDSVVFPTGGVYYLGNFTNGGKPSIIGVVSSDSNTNAFSMTSTGYNTNTNVNAFQLISAAGGNISSGTFTLYGLME